VEALKVYRGTAMVKIGDEVKVGDLLVDGVVLLKEQTVKTNVLASVIVLVNDEYEYRSGKDGEEERALVLAEESVKDKEIIFSTVEKSQSGKEYIYKVQLRPSSSRQHPTYEWVCQGRVQKTSAHRCLRGLRG
jgi:hypothetical protein